MKKVKHKNWLEDGSERFGTDFSNWRFVCPNCKEVYTFKDLKEYTDSETASKYLGFSCIGRLTENRGCDWTLGGLFKIHSKEVIFDDGKVSPVMLFEGETTE